MKAAISTSFSQAVASWGLLEEQLQGYPSVIEAYADPANVRSLIRSAIEMHTSGIILEGVTP